MDPPSDNGFRLPWRISDFLSGAGFAISLAIVSTSLIVFAIRQEGRINLLEHDLSLAAQRAANNEKYIDLIDRGGTREMSAVKETQQRVLKMMEHLSEQTNTLDRRLADTEGRVASEVKNNFDLVRADIKRLDEQQTRILQALDNTYNTLQEALRAGAITRQPTPHSGDTGRPPLNGRMPP